MKKLALFVSIFCLLNSSIGYSSGNMTKVKFENKTYLISLPKNYCNITETFVGAFLLDHLQGVASKNQLMPVPKIVFTQCGKDLQTEDLYPWGYAGFEPRNASWRNQQMYNRLVGTLIDEESLLEILSKDINKDLEDQFSEYEMNADVSSIGSARVVWTDENGVTFSAVNSAVIEGETLIEVVHGTSTLLDDAVVHMYLTDQARGDGSEKEIAFSLISNSKDIKKLN